MDYGNQRRYNRASNHVKQTKIEKSYFRWIKKTSLNEKIMVLQKTEESFP